MVRTRVRIAARFGIRVTTTVTLLTDRRKYESPFQVLAPVRVNHRVQPSAQSVAVPLYRARAACQLHMKDDDPATPSLELSTQKELFF